LEAPLVEERASSPVDAKSPASQRGRDLGETSGVKAG
jgi:hypothetical protein